MRKAEDYLDYTAFSRSGLINQLVEFERFTQRRQLMEYPPPGSSPTF